VPEVSGGQNRTGPRRKILYFAYGSNMDIGRLRSRGIYPEGEPRWAILKGYRLIFNKVASKNPRQGFANIVEQTDAQVEGLLWKLTKGELDKLDGFEGAKSGHYRRLNFRVRLLNGQEVDAITYIASASTVRVGLRPTREYLAHLLAACKWLSRDYVRLLDSTETLD
jgi:gamma-glutamylcyclotransferase